VRKNRLPRALRIYCSIDDATEDEQPHKNRLFFNILERRFASLDLQR